MHYNEMKAFVKSCSDNTGISEDTVYRIVHEIDSNPSMEYTIVRDALNIWWAAIKYAGK
jgi:hypothetical protein